MSECEEPGGPILKIFSQERVLTGPLTTNNCARKCGPRLWGVSAAEGLPQTRPAPSAAAVAPPGRGREPGAETAPPAEMPEPQPPQRPRASPRSPWRQRAGAGIGWKQDASTPAEHLQWPEPDPESPWGLWTRMTPTTTPAWQPLACMSARALIKCRVLGPRVWTPLQVLGSRPRNVHFQWSRGPLLSERQKRVRRAPGVSRRHRFT